MAADNLIVGRNTRVYMAPYASLETLPADTVAFGTAWGDDWDDVGYTQEGLALSIETEFDEIFVDQVEDAMRRVISSRTIMVSTNLAENTLENMVRAVGYGSLSTVAPGSGTRGHDDFTITSGQQSANYSFGFDVLDDKSTEAVRAIIYNGRITSNVSSTYGLTDDIAKLPIEVTAEPDPTTDPPRLLTIRHVLAAV